MPGNVAASALSVSALRQFGKPRLYIRLVFHPWSVRMNTHAMSSSSGTVHREGGGGENGWLNVVPVLYRDRDTNVVPVLLQLHSRGIRTIKETIHY